MVAGVGDERKSVTSKVRPSKARLAQLRAVAAAAEVGAGLPQPVGCAQDRPGLEQSEIELALEKFNNPIDEPVRDPRCAPLIRELARTSHARRHVVVGAGGERRERLPMAVIAASYFLRAGAVFPTTILDVAYRDDHSTSASSGKGRPPRARPGRNG